MENKNKIVNTKIDKYIRKYCDKVTIAERSVYYNFGKFVIRVSDHIGKNSDGTTSIVVDKNNNYILHDHKYNTILVISYNEVKTIIKAMSIYNSIFSLYPNNELDKVNERLGGIQQNILNTKINELRAKNSEQTKIISALKMNFKKYKVK